MNLNLLRYNVGSSLVYLERTKATELEHGEMYQTLTKQAARLQSEKTELKNELSVLIEEKSALESKHEDSVLELAKKQEELDAANVEMASLRESNSSLHQQVSHLNVAFDDAQSACKKSESDLEEQKCAMRALKLQYEEAMAHKDQQLPNQLAGPLYALKTALDHTQAKVEAEHQKVENVKHELDLVNRRFVSLGPHLHQTIE